MKIYVASSWKNLTQPAIVTRLRAAGHEVYDFRNPAPGNTGFGWKSINPVPPPWSAKTTIEVLNHPIAESAFGLDFGAMKWADACVMLQPCGRSAAMELGWMAGAKKITIALLADEQEPELMLKMADHICTDIEDVVGLLKLLESRMENKPVCCVCKKPMRRGRWPTNGLPMHAGCMPIPALE